MEGQKLKSLNFKALFAKLLEFRKGLAFAIVLYAIWTFIEVSIPFLTQLIVDEGVLYGDKDFVILIVGTIVMFNLGGMIADFSKTWIMRNIGVRLNIHIIEDYYEELLGKKYLSFNKINEGQIIQNVNDNMRVEGFLTNSLISFANAIFSLSIFSLILFLFDGRLAIIFILSIVFLVIWDVSFLGLRARIDKERFDMSSKVQNEVIQSVKGIFDIKVNRIQAHHHRLWHGLHQYTSNVRLKILKLAQLYKGGNIVTSELRDGLILVLACLAIINGTMSIGTLLAIQYILGRSRQPVMDLLQVIQDRQDARLSLDRLNAVYEEEEETGVVARPERLQNDLVVEHVNFSYPDSEKGVRDITMKVAFGTKLGLIGESGNGKSTLLKIMLGLYQPESGEIYLEKGERKVSVRASSFGALSQDGYIFNASLAYNIALCDEEDIDRNRLNEVIHVACLDAVVEDMTDREQTLLGRNGVRLSKGQNQRILVARALYSDADIILLDEPTSALDNKTSLTMIDRLLEYCKEKTVIIATHKLFIARKLDRVIVLDQGMIGKEVTHTTEAARQSVNYDDYMI